MYSLVLFVDCLDGIQISSLVTLKEHTEVITKNLNAPICVKFISWKVSQAVLDSIIRANRSRQTNISASQKYSYKVQKRMNRLLITRREFKNDEEKSSWKSYVRYPAMLMVKKPCTHGSQWLGIHIFLPIDY